MNFMTEQRLLDEAVERLVAQFGPERIILFGSQARGDAGPRSDVDLLVVCSVSGRRRDLMVAMGRALRGLPFARDIVVVTPEEFAQYRDLAGTVVRPAAREGRVLYERPAA